MKVEREQRLQLLVDAGRIKWSAQTSMNRDRENININNNNNNNNNNNGGNNNNTSSSSSSSSSLQLNNGQNIDKKWTIIYNLLRAYGNAQGGGEGCCNIHLKGSVMNGQTGQTSTLGNCLFYYFFLNFFLFSIIYLFFI